VVHDETAQLTTQLQVLRTWLFDSALPLWWSHGADRRRGGFVERLAQDGTAIDEPRRLRVQARQAFVFSEAARLGWQGPCAAAVTHGCDYLLQHYRRPDGLYRTRVNADGSMHDDRVVLYDQAFVLLAFASAFALTRSEPMRAAARALHDTLRARLAHRHCGFYETVERVAPLSANSHMHLFEVCQLWSALDDDRRWHDQAQAVAELAVATCIDLRSGALREWFDDDWRAAPGHDGRLVDPGHQFEWAYLLLRYADQQPNAPLERAAFRLLQIGEQHGVDVRRGVVVNALDEQFAVRDAAARLWPQTERIRAACRAARRDPAPWTARAVAATAALQRYLAVPVAGLWLDRIDERGAVVDEPAPASTFYHIVGAILELEQLVAQQGRSA
jgi:mannose/cellobiose epimerase-like protein (N-acyl-D-glucosamine 2-epimerase family)